MRSDNGEQQARVAFVHFSVARSIPHLDPVAFATDQSSLAKNAHVLRQSGPRDGPTKNAHQLGAVLWTFLINDFKENGYTHGISEPRKGR